MSSFRPSARVTTPDGTEWELYAYRLQLPPPRLRDPDGPGGSFDQRADAVADVLDGVAYLTGAFFRLLALLLWRLPRAAIRALGSDEWTIEAVTWASHRTSLTWRTTSEYRGHVLAQVEGQLARGETPKPQHADFLGRRG